MRLGIDEMYNPIVEHRWLFMAAPVVAIPLFIRFGMYRAVMRYFGNDALVAIIKAVTLSSLILAVVVLVQQPPGPRPSLHRVQLLVVEHGDHWRLRLVMRQYFAVTVYRRPSDTVRQPR